MQRRGRSLQMLPDYLKLCALERQFATDPLIDHQRKGILVAGETGHAHYLFRCNITYRPYAVRRALHPYLPGRDCNAEVTEQKSSSISQQDIPRLHIAVNESAAMHVLQGRGDRANIDK